MSRERELDYFRLHKLDQYLAKPISKETLMERVQDLEDERTKLLGKLRAVNTELYEIERILTEE